MTDKSFIYDSKGQPKKLDGWFSWRHKTRESHDHAVATYIGNHGPAARRAKAAERALTPTPYERTRQYRRDMQAATS